MWGLMGFFVRCWKCNLVGHIDANFHTMICYNFYGFGHKSQDFESPRKKPMMSPSYTSTQRSNEQRKTDNDEGANAKTRSKKQVWMKRNVLLNVNEVDQCKEDGFHKESHVWGLLNTLAHLEFIDVEDGLKGE